MRVDTHSTPAPLSLPSKWVSIPTKMGLVAANALMHIEGLAYANRTWSLNSDEKGALAVVACVTFLTACYFGFKAVNYLLTPSAKSELIVEEKKPKIKETEHAQPKRSKSRVSNRELRSLGLPAQLQ